MKNSIKVAILLGVLLYFTLIFAFMLDATSYAKQLLKRNDDPIPFAYFMDQVTALKYQENKLAVIESVHEKTDPSVFYSYFKAGNVKPQASVTIANKEEIYTIILTQVDGEFYARQADLSITIGIDSNDSHIMNINDFYTLNGYHLVFDKGILRVQEGVKDSYITLRSFTDYIKNRTDQAMASDHSKQARVTINAIDFTYVLSNDAYIFTFDYLGADFEAIYLKNDELTIAYHKGKQLILNDQGIIVIDDKSVRTFKRSSKGYDEIITHFISFVEEEVSNE